MAARAHGVGTRDVKCLHKLSGIHLIVSKLILTSTTVKRHNKEAPYFP